MDEWEQLVSDLKAKQKVLKLEIEAKRNRLAGLEEVLWDVETVADKVKTQKQSAAPNE